MVEIMHIKYPEFQSKQANGVKIVYGCWLNDEGEEDRLSNCTKLEVRLEDGSIYFLDYDFTSTHSLEWAGSESGAA